MYKDAEGRLMAVTVGEGKEALLIVNVYAPTHEASSAYRAQLCLCL